MQWWETKTCCGKGVNKNMVGERERDANGGRRVKSKIWDNYRFILPARASYFKFVSKTVSIPEDLICQCN
jgi:hypothetical protein